MFSQTGSEIAALAKHLGKWPDVIITNNADQDKCFQKIAAEILGIKLTKAEIENNTVSFETRVKIGLLYILFVCQKLMVNLNAVTVYQKKSPK